MLWHAKKVVAIHHPATRMQVTQLVLQRTVGALARNAVSSVDEMKKDEVLLALEVL